MVVSLDMMVLLSYHKFGRKLSKEAAQIVTEELQKAIDSNESMNKTWAEQNEEIAQRRFEIYRSVAYTHKQRVLESILTLKSIDDNGVGLKDSIKSRLMTETTRNQTEGEIPQINTRHNTGLTEAQLFASADHFQV